MFYSLFSTYVCLRAYCVWGVSRWWVQGPQMYSCIRTQGTVLLRSTCTQSSGQGDSGWYKTVCTSEQHYREEVERTALQGGGGAVYSEPVLCFDRTSVLWTFDITICWVRWEESRFQHTTHTNGVCWCIHTHTCTTHTACTYVHTHTTHIHTAHNTHCMYIHTHNTYTHSTQHTLHVHTYTQHIQYTHSTQHTLHVHTYTRTQHTLHVCTHTQHIYTHTHTTHTACTYIHAHRHRYEVK